MDGDSLRLVMVEFAVVAGLFIADLYHHIFYSKTPYLFLLGWPLASDTRQALEGCRIHRAEELEEGHSVGGAGVAMEVFELFVSQPLLVRLTGKMPDLSDVSAVAGNLKIALLFLPLTWTLAAFGEELVYRGYLMNRLSGAFHDTKTAWVISLIVSVCFSDADISTRAPLG
jgi:uncharacterized protein